MKVNDVDRGMMILDLGEGREKPRVIESWIPRSGSGVTDSERLSRVGLR